MTGWMKKIHHFLPAQNALTSKNASNRAGSGLTWKHRNPSTRRGQTFPELPTKTFGSTDIEHDSLPRLQARIQPLDSAPAESLEQPIKLEAVVTAFRSGTKHKTPGFVDICFEFYSAYLRHGTPGPP